MNEILHHGLVFAVGTMIGAMFFGGLWWTVRNAPRFEFPGLWFAGSSMLRTFVAIAGFWLVANGNWPNILACMAGFVAVRFVVAWATRPVLVATPVEVADAPQP